MLADEKIEELRKAHGPRLRLLETEGADIVIRPLSRGEYKAWQARYLDDRRRENIPQWLVSIGVVHPSAEEMDNFLEKFPFAIGNLVTEIMEFSGLHKAVEKKDL
jgi:hypothetical protein